MTGKKQKRFPWAEVCLFARCLVPAVQDARPRVWQCAAALALWHFPLGLRAVGQAASMRGAVRPTGCGNAVGACQRMFNKDIEKYVAALFFRRHCRSNTKAC